MLGANLELLFYGEVSVMIKFGVISCSCQNVCEALVCLMVNVLLDFELNFIDKL